MSREQTGRKPVNGSVTRKYFRRFDLGIVTTARTGRTVLHIKISFSDKADNTLGDNHGLTQAIFNRPIYFDFSNCFLLKKDGLIISSP